MEQSIPDLVRDSRLEVQVGRRHVIQVNYVSNPELGQRRVRAEQTWQTVRRLGSGSFGVVWLEECVSSGPDHGKVRAVKEIWKEKATDTAAIEHSRELEAIAKFSQPRYRDCFTQSFGWYETEDAVFITMEYFPKGDLQRYIENALPENEARMITQQILEGLRFMHENQFAHRDMKPANILVLHAGPDWWVKIADFGISKRVHSTVLRTRVGTLAYLAPEVIGFKTESESSDTSSFSFAIDVWSVGAIAYQAITGNIAFPTLKDIQNYVERPSSLAVTSLVNAECNDFILQTLATSPKRRPTSEAALSHPWLKIRTATSTVNAEIAHRPKVDTTNPDSMSLIASNSWSTDRGEETVLLLGRQPQPRLGGKGATTLKNDESPNVAFQSLQLAQELTGHGDCVTSVAFSPDGRRLASGSFDKTVRVWAPDSHGVLKLAQELTDYEKGVWSVAFSPDGKWLATGSSDSTVRVWGSGAAGGNGLLRLAQKLGGRGRSVLSVAFSPDGRQLASGYIGGMVRVWASDSDGVLQLSQELTTPAFGNTVRSIAFSPDGRLATGYFDVMRVWAPDGNGVLRLAQELTGHTRSVASIAFSPDGRWLASGSRDNTVRVWAPDGNGVQQSVQELTGHTRPVVSVTFSPDGRWLASGSLDNTVRIWALDGNGVLQLAQKLTGHRDHAMSVAFSPDSRWLASGSNDDTVRVWALDGNGTSKA